MKYNLILKGNKAYSWSNRGNLWFTGSFFDSQSHLYRGEEALAFLEEHLKNQDIAEVCRNIDGRFCLISVAEDRCRIAGDSVNFFPVFYRKSAEEYWISDRWDALAGGGSFVLNEEAVTEYETAGFVLGNETLARGIFKNNANQILTLTGQEHVVQYQDFFADTFSAKNREKLQAEAEEVYQRAGGRLLTFLQGRTAVVPLSGGYDSRLIVSLLKKLNYTKVICFTYGQNNPEVPISKEVAERLGFSWFFVDFTKMDVAALQSDPQYAQYLDFAGNGFSMPYLMEYFAVHYLQKNKLIPDDSVFLPGHSGDFLGGSYVVKSVKNTIPRKNLARFIAAKYFIFSQKNREEKKNLEKRIANSIVQLGQPIALSSYNMLVEEWDIQEKLSKFIFHSSQVFLFFGYECYFPLWDRELVDFYRQVPYSMRERKELYDEVAETHFFVPLHIHFPKNELKVSAMAAFLQKVKDRVRYCFPWKMVLERINKADWPYYQHLTSHMKNEVEQQRQKPFSHFKNYNAVICAWYIQHLRAKYRKD